MKDRYKFSVIILTYNTPFEKTKLSIDSILNQTFKNIELIISDDASKENHMDEIEQYIVSKKYKDYKLFKNSKNLGIVKHLYNVIKKTNGEYVKVLGGGDYLYDITSVDKMYHFLDDNRYVLAFGKMKKYVIQNNDIIFKGTYKAPRNINIYKNDKTAILQYLNTVVCHDWISGASMFAKRSVFMYYLKKIYNISEYSEDIFQILTFADRYKFKFFDEFIINYEYGVGISTSKRNYVMKKKLKKDINNCIDFAEKEYKNKIVYRILLRIGKNKLSSYNKLIHKIIDYFEKSK